MHCWTARGCRGRISTSRRPPAPPPLRQADGMRGAWLLLHAVLTQRAASRSGPLPLRSTVVVSSLDVGEEGGEDGLGQDVRTVFWAFGVADGGEAGQVPCHLHAAPICGTAAGGLPPLGAGKIGHWVTPLFLLVFRGRWWSRWAGARRRGFG